MHGRAKVQHHVLSFSIDKHDSGWRVLRKCGGRARRLRREGKAWKSQLHLLSSASAGIGTTAIGGYSGSSGALMMMIDGGRRDV